MLKSTLRNHFSYKWFIPFFAVFSYLILLQVVFNNFQKSQGEVILKTIEGILRNEINQSNLDKISMAISDFENIGLFRCTKLSVYWPKPKLFLDLTYKGGCDVSLLLLNGRSVTSEFKSLNGTTFHVSLISNNSSLFYSTLWIMRMVGVISICLIFLYLKLRRDRDNKIKRWNLSILKC